MGNFTRKHLDCTNCQTIALSVFCTLKRNELESLNQYKTSLSMKKGSVIFYESNQPAGLYCVHEGKVKVFKTTDKGDTQIIRLAKDGDIIGYRSLLGNEPYKGTAETLEDSTICFIPRNFIYELLAKNIDLSMKIMASMAKELNNAQQKTLDILYKSSRERLAESLILLHETFGADPNGFIRIRLTREELASITGMVHETVVRILHDWEDEGLIALDKKMIRINDLQQLLLLTRIED